MKDKLNAVVGTTLLYFKQGAKWVCWQDRLSFSLSGTHLEIMLFIEMAWSGVLTLT
jgi:hypothetical protein